MVQEGDYLAVFNSAHRVMKAESVLKALGIPILLIPAPRDLMTDCGLALRIAPELKENITAVLAGEQLTPAFISRFINGRYVTDVEQTGDR